MRYFYAVRPEATRIRWNNDITPFKVTDFGTNRKFIYCFLLVINSNLPPILHLFRGIAVDRSEIAVLGYPSCTPPADGFPWDDLREIFSECQWMDGQGRAYCRAVEILRKIWTAWVGRTNVRDDRRTGDSI